jgi:fructokinase
LRGFESTPQGAAFAIAVTRTFFPRAEMPSPLNAHMDLKPVRPIIFGEVLFDCFSDQKVLGGAPFNVAWNLQGMGAEPLFVSAVGNDDDGMHVRRSMEQWRMDTSGLQTLADRPTGFVEVTINQNEPHYHIRENVAYDFIKGLLSPKQFESAAIFYHGSLAYRSLDNQAAIADLQKRLLCPRFLDINIRQPYFDHQWIDRLLTNLDHLKLNIGELRTLCSEIFFQADNKLVDACRRGADLLRKRYGIKQFWITLGKDGAVWIGADDSWCYEPAAAIGTVIDTVGAGDAFAAVIIEGIVSGRLPSESLQRGNRLAASVCGIRGATTHDAHFYQLRDPDDDVRGGTHPAANRSC